MIEDVGAVVHVRGGFSVLCNSLVTKCHHIFGFLFLPVTKLLKIRLIFAFFFNGNPANESFTTLFKTQ